MIVPVFYPFWWQFLTLSDGSFLPYLMAVFLPYLMAVFMAKSYILVFDPPWCQFRFFTESYFFSFTLLSDINLAESYCQVFYFLTMTGCLYDLSISTSYFLIIDSIVSFLLARYYSYWNMIIFKDNKELQNLVQNQFTEWSIKCR